jgi:hypothetical protein
MRPSARLLLLLLVLAYLLAYIWVRDRPSPAYPEGQFNSILCLAVVAVSAVALVARLFHLQVMGRRLQGSRRRPGKRPSCGDRQ